MPRMALPHEKFPFTAKLIAGAPQQAGVYMLWYDEDVVYIGHAKGRGATIRSLLVEHFSGNLGPCTRRASHYSWQIAGDPGAREHELLEEYRSAHQCLPCCNARE